MNQLEEVRAKVIEAVPEIETFKRKKYAVTEGEFNSDDPSYAYRKVKVCRPIRLSDVLVAIGDTKIIAVDDGGNFLKLEEGSGTGELALMRFSMHGASWNLRADSLDDQSPETIAFLHKILCV